MTLASSFQDLFATTFSFHIFYSTRYWNLDSTESAEFRTGLETEFRVHVQGLHVESDYPMAGSLRC